MIRVVCLEDEVKAMENGIHTLVGTGGIRLSGGQAQRLALARTLYHKRPVLVLDDPFSALDKETEAQIFVNLKELAKDSIIILISHRLYLFDQMDQVIWMDECHTKVGTHEELLATVSSYAELCSNQTKEAAFDAKERICIAGNQRNCSKTRRFISRTFGSRLRCGYFRTAPPLVLAQLIDLLTNKHTLWMEGILLYFGLLA